MMSNSSDSKNQVLRIQKLKGSGIIKIAAQHNLREKLSSSAVSKSGNIDPARTERNYVLRGKETATEVAAEAKAHLDAALLKTPRKDAVRAIEIIFGLPPVSTINSKCFFEDSTSWAERYFKGYVISSVVHLDEAAPHCHLLILPLVNGRLNGSDMMGSQTTLRAHQTDFHEQVGKKYGLARQTHQKRHSHAWRSEAALSVVTALQTKYGLSSDPAVLNALVDAIAENPVPLMHVMGLQPPISKSLKGKTFAGVMTRPTSLERKFRHTESDWFSDAEFDKISRADNDRTLCSVGFSQVTLISSSVSSVPESYQSLIYPPALEYSPIAAISSSDSGIGAPSGFECLHSPSVGKVVSEVAATISPLPKSEASIVALAYGVAESSAPLSRLKSSADARHSQFMSHKDALIAGDWRRAEFKYPFQKPGVLAQQSMQASHVINRMK